VENGPVRTVLHVEKKFHHSVIAQDIIFYEESPKIDFRTDIDWKESQVLLKAAFPLDLVTDKATFEIQYGSVERPTHRNTSWEQAKFEVCAHKYVDLSEGNYGVALMTDCKYGYSFVERQMEVSLLRTPKHPYPEADIGKHKIRYALYPHTSNFYASDVVQKAYAFNNPLIVQTVEKGDGRLPEIYSFVSCEAKNVAIDTVKKAENDDCIVIRAYEFANTQTNTKMSFGFEVDKIIVCDMLERNIQELKVNNRKLSINFKPFEVITCKVYAK